MATQRRRVDLSEMNEADLTAGTGESRIGWVQVGLGEVVEPGNLELPTPVQGYTSLPVLRRSAVEPPMVLPAPVQCFDDALRRFGAVEMAGLQVTESHLMPSTRSCLGDLVGVLNWFNTTQKAEQMRSSPLTKSCLGAILRQSSSPVSSGGTPDCSS